MLFADLCLSALLVIGWVCWWLALFVVCLSLLVVWSSKGLWVRRVEVVGDVTHSGHLSNQPGQQHVNSSPALSVNMWHKNTNATAMLSKQQQSFSKDPMLLCPKYFLWYVFLFHSIFKLCCTNFDSKKEEKGRRKEEMNKNFSLNFYSSAQVVLHKCRLNRGQLHFARKTHSEWQIPKIYQRFDNDNHTIGVNVMISCIHMRAGWVIRERSGVSQQAITENNTPRPEHKHT